MICPPLSVFCLFWGFLCVFASRLTRIDTSPFTDEVPQNQRLLNKRGLNFVCIFLRSPALEGGFPKKLKGMQWGYSFPSFVGVLKDYLYKYIRRTRVYLLSVC